MTLHLVKGVFFAYQEEKVMFINKRKQQELIKKQFGRNPLHDSYHYMRKDRIKLIAKYHDEVGEGTVDDITWNDLEMDDVFFRINHTRSYVGEQVLYHRLHCTDAEEAEGFGDTVSFYENNETERVKAEELLMGLGKRNDCYYMPQLIHILAGYEFKFAWAYRILQALLFLFLILGIVLHSSEFMLAFLGVAGINMFIYMREKSQSEHMMDCLYGICSLINVCEKLLKSKCTPDFPGNEVIREDISRLHSIRRMSGSLISKRKYATVDPQGALAMYIMGITLFDLVSFNKIVRTIRGNEKAVMDLYAFAGAVDSGISVASFRKSLPIHCYPNFIDTGTIIADDIYHPLIENAVPNDVILHSGSMIMGANASGKSTFMKALAVNAILAQSIFTCCGARAEFPKSTVMTSMAVRDDVTTGESYYVREVKYLKRMLDESQKKGCVLYFIDEILKGTNNKERLAASEAVLRYLCKKSGMVIVSTHDSELAERLSDEYEGYHFDSRLTDKGIHFDYRIKSGFGEGTNAIDLLSCYDFPKEVVETARKTLKDQNIA